LKCRLAFEDSWTNYQIIMGIRANNLKPAGDDIGR